MHWSSHLGGSRNLVWGWHQDSSGFPWACTHVWRCWLSADAEWPWLGWLGQLATCLLSASWYQQASLGMSFSWHWQSVLFKITSTNIPLAKTLSRGWVQSQGGRGHSRLMAKGMAAGRCEELGHFWRSPAYSPQKPIKSRFHYNSRTNGRIWFPILFLWFTL